MDEITQKQKQEWVVDALRIIGFAENPEFPGVFLQEHGMKKIVVDLTDGNTVSFLTDGKRTTDDDEYNTLENIMIILTDAEDGKMPTKSEPDEVVHVVDTSVDISTMVPTVTKPSLLPILGTPPDLTVETIKKYINDKASDEEAYVFLQLCKARGLNPFLKEAYLIKYDHVKPATMVVGKDTFMKRAETHPMFSGIQSGIIVGTGDEHCIIDEREGAFYLTSELSHIVGGWAKVYRKDRDVPTVSKVAFSEYVGVNSQGQPNRIWGSKPATMIRKVAVVQALREAFPTDLGGWYDQCEMGIEEVVE